MEVPLITDDPELGIVAKALRNEDPTGSRISRVLRNTIDQLYDGQRSGRYRWDQLFKTEKTHCGTLVEINLQREFKFKDGVKLDYLIESIEVDCKYSQRIGGWMIPPEAEGHICMLLTAEDGVTPTWNLGLVRVRSHLLGAKNRDGKRTLSVAGRSTIHWLWHGASLPPNVLLQLDPVTVGRIMSMKHGTKRVDELFRSALGRIVGRGVIATVAQQDDYMKRLRENGGSRSSLRAEGIVILGQYGTHTRIAADLLIPCPGPGESISVRVTPVSKNGLGVAHIQDGYWKVANDGDPVVQAPLLPKTKSKF